MRGRESSTVLRLKTEAPSDAANVTLTDAVPAEIADAELSLNGGKCVEYLEAALIPGLFFRQKAV